MFRLILRNIILVFLVFLYCDTTEPEEDVEITVSSGNQPTFSWTIGPVNKLKVETHDGSGVVWAVYTPGKDSLFSSVKYLEVPSGAQLLTNTTIIGPVDQDEWRKSLIIGKKYVVKIADLAENNLGIKVFTAH
ncbi:hypothetical protein ACFL4T_04525 [candidate division KSB1 bacterium]